jgi:enoyl-CoA hydratase/carnithine racemase
MGGGLNIALCADVRYAADTATFCVPPAKLGIGYPSPGRYRYVCTTLYYFTRDPL